VPAVKNVVARGSTKGPKWRNEKGNQTGKEGGGGGGLKQYLESCKNPWGIIYEKRGRSHFIWGGQKEKKFSDETPTNG